MKFTLGIALYSHAGSLVYRLSRLSFSSPNHIVDDDLQTKANPVLQGIKIVMGLSLAVVHIHSHILGRFTHGYKIVARPGDSKDVAGANDL